MGKCFFEDKCYEEEELVKMGVLPGKKEKPKGTEPVQEKAAEKKEE